jgi:hypothetical protein
VQHIIVRYDRISNTMWTKEKKGSFPKKDVIQQCVCVHDPPFPNSHKTPLVHVKWQLREKVRQVREVKKRKRGRRDRQCTGTEMWRHVTESKRVGEGRRGGGGRGSTCERIPLTTQSGQGGKQ